jgi:hypothetical protein
MAKVESRVLAQAASHDISSEERFFPGFPRRFFAYFTQSMSKNRLENPE